MVEALLWGAVGASALVVGARASAGYLALDPASRRTGALVEPFAAGALLAMVADTLLPESFRVEGVFTGSLVAGGFAVSLVLAAP